MSIQLSVLLRITSTSCRSFITAKTEVAWVKRKVNIARLPASCWMSVPVTALQITEI